MMKVDAARDLLRAFQCNRFLLDVPADACALIDPRDMPSWRWELKVPERFNPHGIRYGGALPLSTYDDPEAARTSVHQCWHVTLYPV